MAFLYISEYAALPVDGSGNVMKIPKEPALAEQRIANTGATTQSAAFDARTRYLMIHADSICSYLVGANPTALATGKRMAAGETRFLGVEGGHKIAAILNT